MTQFKVKKEQARLTELAERSDQKEQQTAIDAVNQIEAKAMPLSSNVMLERSEYESLAVAAKKYVAQEKKESLLQKALDAAHKMIAGLEAKAAGSCPNISLSEISSIQRGWNSKMKRSVANYAAMNP